MSATTFIGTVTITYGDQVENHIGMEKLGNARKEGFTVQELREARDRISDSETIEMSYAGQEAAVLVIRHAVDMFGITADEIAVEHAAILGRYDKTFFDTRRKKVLNKHLRYNACFADYHQDPDIDNGKGTVFSFKDEVPLLGHIRDSLGEIFGEKAKGLLAEGNYYYDPKKCGIGWHGDAERVIVIGLRIGEAMPLKYRWYHQSKPIGESMEITLEHGDMYVMSHKATGNDWKLRKIPTLRHTAGCEKCIKDAVVKETEEEEEESDDKSEGYPVKGTEGKGKGVVGTGGTEGTGGKKIIPVKKGVIKKIVEAKVVTPKEKEKVEPKAEEETKEVPDVERKTFSKETYERIVLKKEPVRKVPMGIKRVVKKTTPEPTKQTESKAVEEETQEIKEETQEIKEKAQEVKVVTALEAPKEEEIPEEVIVVAEDERVAKKKPLVIRRLPGKKLTPPPKEEKEESESEEKEPPKEPKEKAVPRPPLKKIVVKKVPPKK